MIEQTPFEEQEKFDNWCNSKTDIIEHPTKEQYYESLFLELHTDRWGCEDEMMRLLESEEYGDYLWEKYERDTMCDKGNESVIHDQDVDCKEIS